MNTKTVAKKEAQPLLLSEGFQALVVNAGLFFVLFQFVDLTKNIIQNLNFMSNMLIGFLYITLGHGILTKFSFRYQCSYIGLVTDSIKQSLAAWSYAAPITYLVLYLVLKMSSDVLYGILG